MARKSSPKAAATPEENRVRMTFYIDKPALAELQARNRETGVPVAYMVRLAIDQFIDRGSSSTAGAAGKTAGMAEELRGE